MGNIIEFLQSIFLGKETETTRIGLSEFKKKKTTTTIPALKRKSIFTKQPAQELRLSELMRKGSY